MNTENTHSFDDVGEAIREGRELRSASAYRILFALENLTFRAIEVNDPVPLGRQILSAAGLRANQDYSLFAIVETGDFEDLRLDEPFDLRGRGAEQVTDSHQTFEQLVALAYPGEAPTPEIVYSITYRGVFSKPHSGELAAGGFIEVKNGSVINVSRTIQS